MLCPVCDESTLIIELEEVELDLCVECGGLWFDTDELQLLFASAGADGDPVAAAIGSLPDQGTDRRLRCPRCSQRLHYVQVPSHKSLHVDRCPDGDGLWFDRGELRQLLSGSLEKDSSGFRRIAEFLGRFAGSAGAEPDGP